MPGDRFVLRESGRDETVGGGEVLDIAPVRPASKATPDRSVDRVIAERGWVTVDDLEALTGDLRTATVGAWVVSPDAFAATQASVRTRILAADEFGLDLASLDERERATVSTLESVAIDAGRARPVAAADPLANHPFLAVLQAGGTAPPDPVGVEKAQLRELVRRKLIVECDGLYFHPTAIDAAARAAAELLRANPDGFTMSQLRGALGNTRKHAVPLATELDARGITRRRGDVRIPGPRLP